MKPWKYKASKLCTGHRRQLDKGKGLTPIKVKVDRSRDNEREKACSGCGLLRLNREYGPKSGGGLRSACLECESVRAKAKRYGISEDEVRAAEATERCMICKTDNPGDRGWAIDHDHDTGAVRGVLCQFCNVGLGMFRDNIEALESAISYLKEPPGIGEV